MYQYFSYSTYFEELLVDFSFGRGVNPFQTSWGELSSHQAEVVSLNLASIYGYITTFNVQDSNPNLLEIKVQTEANISTAWVKDNKLVCSGSKTKLLIVGTKEMRKSKLLNQNKTMSINVDGHNVTKTSSERLLGLIVNNTLTWEHHLHGNEDHRGLVPKLAQRAGIIRKLSFIMPEDRQKTIAEVIFFSLLNYCI